MTTSISNAWAAADTSEAARTSGARAEVARTLWSRFIILLLCLAVVLSTLAYGAVHYWAQAVFTAGAASLILLWAMDAWRSGTLRLSRNPLQWPLVGLCAVGLLHLLPLAGGARAVAPPLASAPVRSLSLDPYSMRLALVQVMALLVYFAAALAFIDSPKRLRLVVRIVTVFGFLLAILGLIQSFTSPTKVYWMRELAQSTPFGPFINRHHFATYMQMTLALPLGLLFSGAVERDKRPLYAFAAAIMGVALIMTNSRGGLIALVAEIFFLTMLAGFKGGREAAEGDVGRAARGALVRAGLAAALIVAILAGVLMFGGEGALTRFLGTVNAEDPTTGRVHFWGVTLDIIRDNPVLGAGLGAFGLAFTRYDTRGGLMRVEQAHNDYLQTLADAGIVGAALGLFFLVALFRMGLKRRETKDVFRRGVATGALAGCFAALVHSFFDFPLHTTANALLFLLLAALATLGPRVEQASAGRGRRRRRRRSVTQPEPAPVQSHAGALPTRE